MLGNSHMRAAVNVTDRRSILRVDMGFSPLWPVLKSVYRIHVLLAYGEWVQPPGHSTEPQLESHGPYLVVITFSGPYLVVVTFFVE